MAKLPDAPTVFGPAPNMNSGRPVASIAATAIARGEGVAAAAIERGVEGLGAGGITLGRGLIAGQEADDKLDLAKAQARFVAGRIELDTEFAQDGDYATAEKRYVERLDTLKEDAKGVIARPELHERFEQLIGENYLRGVQGIKTKVYGQERDANVGYVLEQGINYVRSAPLLPDGAGRTDAIDNYHHLVDGLKGKGYINSVQALQMKQKFADDYISTDAQTLIQRDPGEAARRLADDRDPTYSLLDPHKRYQLKHQAINAGNADILQEERSIRLQERAVHRASDAAENEALKDIYSDDPKLTVPQIINNDTLTREAKARLVSTVARANKPDPLAQVSQGTSIALLERMRRPDGDPEKIADDKPIYDAYFQGKLNKADFHDLRKELLDAKTPAGQALSADRAEFFKRYAASIDGAMDLGGHSALGSQKLYAAERDVRRQEELLKKKGLDPHLIYDPTSEHFFGKPANIAKYRVSMQDAMKYNEGLAKAEKAAAEAKPTTNLTGPGKSVISTTVQDIPEGMSPADALKLFKSGTKVRLPDGRIGTVP